MRKLVVLATVFAGFAVGLRALTPERRDQVKGRVATVIEHCPPVKMMSSLERLDEQNQDMIALLREQNDLLKQEVVERTLQPT